jgi:MoxR-like ATPase
MKDIMTSPFFQPNKLPQRPQAPQVPQYGQNVQPQAVPITPSYQPEQSAPQPSYAPPAPQQPVAPVQPSVAPERHVDIQNASDIIKRIVRSYSSKLVGQEGLKTSLIISLIAGGHVLLESLPGLAKTTAGSALADSVHASFKRIQCTPDLLPSDIIGTQIYDHESRQFETKLGPVHANFVLLDEVNRSSAKTQSAMLEAMQEQQTSIGGEIYALPKPFMVIATQNPIEQEGTYRLPEAQLDRFLVKEIVDYPTPEEELEILARIDSGVLDSDTHVSASVSLDEVLWLQKEAGKVNIAESTYKYIINIVNATRNIGDVLGEEYVHFVNSGVSPRASIAFMKTARALALLNGRDYVVPDDIKTLRHIVLRHRLLLSFDAEVENVSAEHIIDKIFESVPTP